MRNKLLNAVCRICLSALAILVLLAPLCAQTEITLYRFTDGAPNGGLIADAAGNLYGTSYSGGSGNYGYVFELSDSAGVWSQDTLYKFQGPSSGDGAKPAAGLVSDSKGNLFGTTYYGGVGGFCFYGCGTVFGLMPQADGSWKERVLHRFKYGGTPASSLVIDSAGNLYGTKATNGGNNPAAVYELSSGSRGIWNYTNLYVFPNTKGNQGTRPAGPVVFDSAGNLYGTASEGGQYKQGTAYRLTPGSSGWTFTALYAFGNGPDGADPMGGLVVDAAGNLYGTTADGGANGFGIVFELSPRASGRWKETILHQFSAEDGENPQSSLIFDTAGNLYGVAPRGGANGYGTIFELSPTGGSWDFTILYSFSGGDGRNPSGPLLYLGGNLYGVAGDVAFELIP